MRLLPGGMLSVAVTFTAIVMQALETGLFGRAWIEALVLAILLGTVVCSAWAYGPAWAAGVQFSAGTDGSLAPASPRLRFSRLVSWFVMGFLALGALCSLDILIHAVIGPAAAVARPCRCWCWCWAGSASR